MTKHKTEIILALDVEDHDQASSILDQVGDSLSWVKVGLQSYLRDGPKIIQQCVNRDKNVFLDLKLHDIPNTMAKAIESLSALPIQMLTLHCCSGSEALTRCAETARKVLPQTTLLGVTVLTSMNQSNLEAVGVSRSPQDQVSRLAKLAVESGIGGIVCSPLELIRLRSELPGHTKLVTPGIRPTGSDAGDQKRTMTPKDAQEAGADYLVIGRPILAAKEPMSAIRSIVEELEN